MKMSAAEGRPARETDDYAPTPMTPEIERRLANFMARHRPDSRQYLALFREEIVLLHFAGYSMRSTHAYLKEQGVGCSLSTLERWVRESIDFDKEAVPEAAKRCGPWVGQGAGASGAEEPEPPAQPGRAGEGEALPAANPARDEQSGPDQPRARSVGDAATAALLSADAPRFSLAGAPAASPALRPAVGEPATQLPKHGVLVDGGGGPSLQSETDSSTVRKERLAKVERARKVREELLRNPVERALDKERNK